MSIGDLRSDGLKSRLFLRPCCVTRCSTPEVPFGETFKTRILYLVEGKDDGRTWLSISSECAFTGKRPFIAGQIEAGVKKGTIKTFVGLCNLILESVEGPTKKKRVNKVVGGSKGRSLFVMTSLSILMVVWAWFGFRISGMGKRIAKMLVVVLVHVGKLLVFVARVSRQASEKKLGELERSIEAVLE